MSPKIMGEGVEQFHPKNQSEWRRWLEENHDSQQAIWLVLHKKKSPNFNLSWSDAVDEALCFGWIDSTKRTLNEQAYIQYFTQRKPKSNWSKVNKEKVAKLIDAGLMQAAGFKSIEIAKENGSWVQLDAVEELKVPEDLETALKTHAEAYAYFNQLSKSVRKGMLYWVISAKRTATREKRIAEIVQNAGENQKPKAFR